MANRSDSSYLRTVYARNQLFRKTKTILTIHNLGYQGVFSSDCASSLLAAEFHPRLDREDLHQGRVNLLKTGITHADCLTTVSPTYSREIQTAEYGAGLDYLLRARSPRMVGILNGVDYDRWSPQLDPHIAVNYSRQAPIRAKQANQRRAPPGARTALRARDPHCRRDLPPGLAERV